MISLLGVMVWGGGGFSLSSSINSENDSYFVSENMKK